MHLRVPNKMYPVKRRKSYTAAFKLEVVAFSESHSKRATARHFGIDERNVRAWQKKRESLKRMKSTKKANRGSKPRGKNCLSSKPVAKSKRQTPRTTATHVDEDFGCLCISDKLPDCPTVRGKKGYRKNQNCNPAARANYSMAETQFCPSQISAPHYTQTYVVRNHHSYVFDNLSNLWKNGKLCDASVGNGKAKVMVHKIVLIALSPKLLSLSDTEVLKEDIFHVNLPKDIGEEALWAFARYMYDGILTLDNNIICDMEQISKFFALQELQTLCKKYRQSSLSQTQNNKVVNTNFHPLVTEIDVNCDNQILYTHQPLSIVDSSNVSTLPGEINIELIGAEMERYQNHIDSSGMLLPINTGAESVTGVDTEFRILSTQGKAVSFWSENMAAREIIPPAELKNFENTEKTEFNNTKRNSYQKVFMNAKKGAHSTPIAMSGWVQNDKRHHAV